MEWNFNAQDFEEKSFEVIPVGDHRFRIEEANETKSSKGNPMIKVTLAVSGKNSKLFHNINFMPDNVKLTNQLLGEFWTSFGIQLGNLNVSTWIGKVGAGRVKHEIYNGENQAKIAYFKNPKQAEKLPAWVEPSNSSGTTAANSDGFMPVGNADVPFDTSDIPL